MKHLACSIAVCLWVGGIVPTAVADETALIRQTEQLGFRSDEATQVWPQWRGLDGAGVAVAASLPTPWPEKPLMSRWETPIGAGWSSPVVARGRVFITDRQGGTERTIALDANTGKFLWAREHPVDFDPHLVGRRHGNGPKSTPLVDASAVYSLGIAGVLSCCAVADGKLLWSRNFPAEFGRVQELPGGRARVNREESVIVPIGNGQGAPVPLFGYTGSLLPVDELLVCSVGGQRGGTIMAFDRATGKEVWRALDENVSYSSPVIADLAGVRQIVVMTGPRVVGLEPRSGKLLWSYPFQLQYDESISTPVVTDNLVIVGGTGMALTAVAVERRGNSFEARRKWENFDLCSYLSSMIAVGDTLFGMNDGGEFNAVSLVDGKTLWNGGRHGYYSTPVRDGNRLLCLNERAVLGVISAERDQFVQLGRSPLSQADSWTSPAVVEGRIYVRDSSAVRCFEPGR